MTTTANPNECCERTDSLWVKVSGEVSVCKKDLHPDQCYEKNRLYPTEGYAVTQDPPNLLLVATDCITGIECPKLWQGSTPHYWELAWKVAKDLLNKDQDRIGMAMNAKYDHNDQPIRDYNQLHIHVSCIQTEVQNYLQQNDSQITRDPTKWKNAPLQIPPKPKTGYDYRVLCLENDGDLATKNLFKLLREDVVGTDPEMQYQTLVVARRKIAGKAAGFYVLNSQSKGMPNGTGAGERNLLDEKCS